MVLRPYGIEHPLTIGAAPTAGRSAARPVLAAWLAGRADGADLTVSPDGELPDAREVEVTMTYTGDVTRGGAPASATWRPDHHQGVGRPDGQQRLPVGLRPTTSC